MFTEIAKYWVWSDDLVCNIANLKNPIENSKPYNGEQFIKPMYNPTTQEVYEGASESEIAEIIKEKKKSYLSLIYQKTDELYTSAIARAVGKSGQGLAREQLDRLQAIYAKKYEDATNVLNGSNVSLVIIDLFIFEIENDFTDERFTKTIAYVNSLGANIDTSESKLFQYCKLIQFKFISGNAQLNYFKPLIENFRSRLITNLDKNEFEKIDQRFAIVEQINNSTTLQEIEILNTQFNSL